MVQAQIQTGLWLIFFSFSGTISELYSCVQSLSSPQKEGLITLLPKGDKPRQFLKNWRPVTLLNVLYKIASGCIANRIKRVFPNIIHSDQTGFINGRCISENTRLLYDIIHYTEKINIPGLLLLIDFEKAFNSVSWSFIKKTLSFFRSGPDKKYIKNGLKYFTKISNLELLSTDKSPLGSI